MARYFLCLARFAPLVYLATALPTVVFMTYLTPPSQAPDETNHFRRAVQLLRGQIVGHPVSPTDSGGVIAKSTGEFAEALNKAIGHAEVRVDPSVMRAMHAIRWNRSDREYDSFVNTVIYPPFFYVPALGALALGQTLDLGVFDSFTLARLATGLTAVGMGALAIGLAMRGRALLFVLLSLPMTLYLFASLTQDALLVASVALVAGLCSRAAGRGRPFSTGERFLVAALVGAAVAARPPYFPLLGILLTSLLRPPVRASVPSARLLAVAPFGLALAVAAGWLLFGAGPAKVPFRVSDGVSMASQVDYLMHHIGSVPDIAERTLSGSGLWHYKQFIGVLGWSDTYLPAFYYPLASLALVVAAVLVLFETGQALGRAEGLFLFVGWILAWAATYAVLYLTWTPVGADSVDGVQGRYFLASTMLLVPALPALAFWVRAPRAAPTPGAFLAAPAWLLLFGAAAASDWSLPQLVLTRFYV